MRVGIAVIKLVLRANKVLADGTHPIMLRVSFHGMKERSSGYSCSVKSWDKKNECIKRGYPNFVMVNAELRKIKEEAIRKRDSLIALGVEYTPSMILFKEEVKSSLSFNLKDLIEDYIHSKGIAQRTSEKYHTLFNSISKFIDLNCRYYSYRHSYIMSEIQKPNVNLLKLATETGKSITSLHEYLTILNDLDLI